MTIKNISITTSRPGPLEVTISDTGEGHPFLLLHGGGSPNTVSEFARRFAADENSHARVITPTHPGFNGTARPETLTDIPGLAALYVNLLDELDLDDVTVVGNSIGGWIAAEIAIIGSPRVSSYVIVDAVGLEVPGHPVVDFFSLTPAQIAKHSYHDPATYGIDPSTLSPEAQQAMAANRQALATYGGQTMTDPDLAARLGTINAPVLVVWGEADRIADPDYGRAYARAIPGAEYELLTETGHLPQIETPDKLIDTIWTFADRHAAHHPNSDRPESPVRR
ncbi:MAG: alpha/beta hydrolase [Solirubrobacterales bacterium]|nr:alpha/beta hydrolase [Solirubrobacterales bacterium]